MSYLVLLVDRVSLFRDYSTEENELTHQQSGSWNPSYKRIDPTKGGAVEVKYWMDTFVLKFNQHLIYRINPNIIHIYIIIVDINDYKTIIISTNIDDMHRYINEVIYIYIYIINRSIECTVSIQYEFLWVMICSSWDAWDGVDVTVRAPRLVSYSLRFMDIYGISRVIHC